jgi:hypothetical protein
MTGRRVGPSRGGCDSGCGAGVNVSVEELFAIAHRFRCPWSEGATDPRPQPERPQIA